MPQVNLKLRKLGKPITIISHPRSGTHLTIDLIRRQFISCQARKKLWEHYHKVYLSIEVFFESRVNKRLSEIEALDVVSRLSLIHI